jgi:hypothetical protein
VRSDRTSRNNPNHLPLPDDVHHKQQSFVSSFTDNHLRHSVRVPRVPNQDQRIQKYFACLLEGDAMLPEVRRGLLTVPFEQQPAQ